MQQKIIGDSYNYLCIVLICLSWCSYGQATKTIIEVFNATVAADCRHRCTALKGHCSVAHYQASTGQCYIYTANCGPLANPPHGVVMTPGGTLYSETAAYSCNSGYTVWGNSTRTCQVYSTWSSTSPSCLAVDCRAPGSTADGVVQTPGGTRQPNNASYTCHTGYNLIGTAVRQCEINGTWSGAVPVCQGVDCGPPGNPTNGAAQSPGGTRHPNTANYICNTGYTLIGAAVRQCQANAVWSGAAPACLGVDCGPPGKPTNGVAQIPQGNRHPNTASYTCNNGYTLIGAAVRQCQANAVWSGAVPACQVPGRTAVICNGNRGTLKCALGKTIYIVGALYGRQDRTTCPSPSIRTTTCALPAAKTIASSLCNGVQQCSLVADPIGGFNPDPCPNTHKYLKIDYKCVWPGG